MSRLLLIALPPLIDACKSPSGHNYTVLLYLFAPPDARGPGQMPKNIYEGPRKWSWPSDFAYNLIEIQARRRSLEPSKGNHAENPAQSAGAPSGGQRTPNALADARAARPAGRTHTDPAHNACPAGRPNADPARVARVGSTDVARARTHRTGSTHPAFGGAALRPAHPPHRPRPVQRTDAQPRPHGHETSQVAADSFPHRFCGAFSGICLLQIPRSTSKNESGILKNEE